MTKAIIWLSDHEIETPFGSITYLDIASGVVIVGLVAGLVAMYRYASITVDGV